MSVRTLSGKRSPYDIRAVADASFTIGEEATNAITVNVQLKDKAGGDLAVRAKLDWFLSTDANGDSLATAASGGVAGGTDGVVASTITGRAGFAVSEADGDVDFVITDTSARSLYLVLVMPDGTLKPSTVITFA